MVDDDPQQRSDVTRMLESNGYQVVAASDGEEALTRLAGTRVSAILTDLVMPRMDGMALLQALAARGDRTPTIVLTGFGSIDHAISIVHELKAFWFLEKPVDPGILRTLLERAIQQNQLIEETDRLNRELSYQGILGDLVGESPAMQEVFSIIRQVAPTTASVFVSGESGTGKELVARAIHRLSTRGSGPFVAVNCAALPETLVESELFGHEKGSFTGAVARRVGCFEQAQNGTLFLDEIGEMPISIQAKLLRALEEGSIRRIGGSTDIPCGARVLAATNRQPDEAIRSSHLREDLYYRLNVFHISLPPLRERVRDIGPITAAQLRSLNLKHNCRVTHLNADAMRWLETNQWPGNVRELRNVLERAVIMAGEGEIQLRHLPGALQPRRVELSPNAPEGVLQFPAGHRMSDLEDAYLRLTLQYTNDNKTRAAQILGISLRTLHNRINAFGKSKARAAGAGQGSGLTE